MTWQKKNKKRNWQEKLSKRKEQRKHHKLNIHLSKHAHASKTQVFKDQKQVPNCNKPQFSPFADFCFLRVKTMRQFLNKISCKFHACDLVKYGVQENRSIRESRNFTFQNLLFCLKLFIFLKIYINILPEPKLKNSK